MAKKKKILLTSIVLIIGFLIGRSTNFSSEASWSGVYYPQGNLSGSAIYSPNFKTKEECIGWAVNEMGLRPEDENVNIQDLWECSKNCKIDSSYSNSVNHSQEFILENKLGTAYLCEEGFDGGDWLRGDF